MALVLALCLPSALLPSTEGHRNMQLPSVLKGTGTLGAHLHQAFLQLSSGTWHLMKTRGMTPTPPCHTFNSKPHCLGENWFQLKVRDNFVNKNHLCWISHSQAKETVTHSTSGSASEPKCVLPLLSSCKEPQTPPYNKSLAPLCPYHKPCFGALHTLQISAIIDISVGLPGLSGTALRQQHWEMEQGCVSSSQALSPVPSWPHLGDLCCSRHNKGFAFHLCAASLAHRTITSVNPWEMS